MGTAADRRPRRLLTDEIDRLDGVIDCLANNLDAAVAEVAREGTRRAVREVLLEVLTDPALRAIAWAVFAPDAGGPDPDAGG